MLRPYSLFFIRQKFSTKISGIFTLKILGHYLAFFVLVLKAFNSKIIMISIFNAINKSFFQLVLNFSFCASLSICNHGRFRFKPTSDQEYVGVESGFPNSVRFRFLRKRFNMWSGRTSTDEISGVFEAESKG